MKLETDCIRDILIAAEDNTGYNMYLDFPSERSKCPSLEKYDNDTVRYHILQCCKAGLIELAGKPDLGGNIGIKDLTPSGHEFLANIRSETVWQKVKNIGSKIGATSVPALAQIASNVVSAIIKAELGLS